MFRKTRYQYYTNVNYLTCADCLMWHGKLRRSTGAFPSPDDGCESAILKIPGRQLRAYRRRSKRMRARAQAELARRALLEHAVRVLPEHPDEALDLLRRAAGIDVYIPEIERLADVHREFLDANDEVKDQLRAQLVKAYSDKFGWRRYERLPELMRIQREQAGKDRINEILG